MMQLIGAMDKTAIGFKSWHRSIINWSFAWWGLRTNCSDCYDSAAISLTLQFAWIASRTRNDGKIVQQQNRSHHEHV